MKTQALSNPAAPSLRGDESVRISVVVPTCRRPALLARCLASLLAQRFDARAFEVIVVDDGHCDETRAVVAALAPQGAAPRVHYLRPDRGRHGPAVARNCGWRAAQGPVIAFTDDDTVADPDWLACGEWSLRGGHVAVCGRVHVPVSRPPTDHELMTRGLESAQFVTANAFVRKSALVRIGGFDERFTRAWREDSDLQFRLMREAGAVGRSAEASVTHPVRAEAWGVSLRQQKNAYFDALLYKKHPRLYRQRIRRVPPWHFYLVVALALAAPLLLLAGQTTAALVSLLGVLGLVLGIAATRLWRTAHTPSHVAEMLATSALIPFLSVYWRVRGAIHFRVLFL